MSSVEVVIPVWNSKAWLARCLAALERQTLKPSKIIFVDDASTDGTGDWLAQNAPQVHLERLEHHRGFAATANHGINAGTAPLVALLNVDTEADDDWLSELVRAIDAAPEEVGSAASRMIQLSEPRFLDNAGDRFSRYGSATKRGRGQPVDDWATGGPILSASAGAAIYRRSMLDRIGLFDESFGSYLEDIELGLRAQLAGYGCLYVPAARVRHEGGGSGLPRAGYVRLITANRAATILQTFPGRLLLRHCHRLLWGQWYFFVASRHPGRSLLGYWDLLRRWRRVLSRRREVLSRALIGADELDRLLESDLGEPALRHLVRKRLNPS